MWKFIGNQRPSFAIEPGEGQESVWDYPRPPVCVEDQRRVIVTHQGTEIANTQRAVRVLETASPPTFYLPAVDVKMELLKKTPGSSFCEWKGAATYWSLVLDGQTVKNAAWSYSSPSPSFAPIRDHVAFYPAMVDCTVDGQPVRSQTGGFYGGWITDEVIGPYKGESGTSAW